MISFFQLPLNEEILKALVELEIDYVFQPIFHKDGKEVYAYEALMRPNGKSVLELIDEYKEAGNLHVLEVATFFGAAQAYKERGYEKPVCINSFPSESFTEEENRVFQEYFSDYMRKGIIEMHDSPDVSTEEWMAKQKLLRKNGMKLAFDNFGGDGELDMEHFDVFAPQIVKLDRSLIANIDSDPAKQEECKDYVENLHIKHALVLAEGVETLEEFEFLKTLNIDLYQGYYLARPE